MQPQYEGMVADDLAVEIEDEYNPMLPNSYEQVVRERKEEREKLREEEVLDTVLQYNRYVVYIFFF